MNVENELQKAQIIEFVRSFFGEFRQRRRVAPPKFDRPIAPSVPEFLRKRREENVIVEPKFVFVTEVLFESAKFRPADSVAVPFERLAPTGTPTLERGAVINPLRTGVRLRRRRRRKREIAGIWRVCAIWESGVARLCVRKEPSGGQVGVVEEAFVAQIFKVEIKRLARERRATGVRGAVNIDRIDRERLPPTLSGVGQKVDETPSATPETPDVADARERKKRRQSAGGTTNGHKNLAKYPKRPEFSRRGERIGRILLKR